MFASIFANAQVSDYGMTSEPHKKYVGQIVFSKSPIEFQNENPDEFTSDFNFFDDKAYFMAYFPKSIANQCYEEHGFMPGIYNAFITFTFFVGDTKAGTVELDLNADQLNKWTGYSDPYKPFSNETKMLPKYGFLFRDNVLPLLKKGENIVKMVIGYKVRNENKDYTNKKPVTEGTMNITMKEDYKVVLKAPPKAVKKDAALEEKIKKALAFRWKKTTVIVKVILTEKEWRVEKNALGVPLRKVLKVYAITKPIDGEYANNCFATPYEVKRKFIGNGKYSDEIIWYSSGGRPNYEVECE